MVEKLFINSDLEFVSENKDEAFASVSLNPSFQWAKMIVCDDLRNANGMRVPVEEFDNMISTGVLAPVKMAEGGVSDGHDEAMGHPLGTISHLQKVGNKLYALAALWKRERPDDIEYLKEAHASGKNPQISWELWYTENAEDEDGTKVLKGVSLNGVTVVGRPAYEGRTPIIAFASKEADESNSEANNKSEENSMELEELKAELDGAKASLTAKDAEIASALEELNTLKGEVEELRSFKAGIEQAKAELDKLEAIRAKFIEAGIEKSETYFDENKSRFLAMGDEDVDFMLQELVSFAKTQEVKENVSSKIPNLKADRLDKADVKTLARALRSYIQEN